MEQQLLQTGEEAISKLPGRAAEVQGLVSANFAAKSLADVQASFEAAFASGAPGAVNAEVVKVHTLVREQAAQASQPGQSALGRSSLCGPHPSTCSGKAPEALAAWMPTMGLWRPLVPAQSRLTAPPPLTLQAVEDLKAVEMWLQIKTPEVADGNNFGVEVQAFVAGELKVPDGP